MFLRLKPPLMPPQIAVLVVRQCVKSHLIHKTGRDQPRKEQPHIKTSACSLSQTHAKSVKRAKKSHDIPQKGG